MKVSEFWQRVNTELVDLTPEQAECALAWLADTHGDDVLAAIGYAKGRCPQ